MTYEPYLKVTLLLTSTFKAPLFWSIDVKQNISKLSKKTNRMSTNFQMSKLKGESKRVLSAIV